MLRKRERERERERELDIDKFLRKLVARETTERKRGIERRKETT